MAMPAVRLHGVRDLRFEHIEAPETTGEQEVIVAVEAAGICGSDLHNYRTGQWLTRAPSVPGHEFCARVVKAGSRVTALAQGDRVVADSRVFCRNCESCRAGKPQLCRSIGYVGEVIDGGFASLARLPEHQLVRLPDQEIPATVAVMAEPLAVALHAAALLAPDSDAPIIIAGAGPIGALAAIVLAHGGFGPLYVIDRNAARRDLVGRLTGARALALDDIEGSTGRWRPHAVETTGSAAVARRLIDTLSPGGRMVSVGIFDEEAGLDLNRIVEGEIELRGCAAFSGELGTAVELLDELAGKLSLLAGPAIGLADVPRVYGELCEGRTETVKTIIDPGRA
jgi:(R,R)-butanediol dehydrogenase/meso-butanediol dehydrogenase/diacetyl reductase